MTPDYIHMPLEAQLEALQLHMDRHGVPPMDLVVALMGQGIDVERVMDQMQLVKETQ